MNILLLHNLYQHHGGEEAVLAQEQALLIRHGHQVESVTVSNDSVQHLGAKLRVAWQAAWSPRGHALAKQALSRCQPDVVHVHNFFPLLSPAIFDACQEAGVPVVMTLHNYRLICPGALLMGNGRVCEQCVSGSAYQAVRHGCYRGSRLGTLAVARMVEYHRRQRTWHEKVDRFIALTDFARQKFIAGGLPADKIVVKPNFVMRDVQGRTNAAGAGCTGAGDVQGRTNAAGQDDAQGWASAAEARTSMSCRTGAAEAESSKLQAVSRNDALFVGRLSAEKGVATLLTAWQGVEVPLGIVGDGPLRGMAEQRKTAAISLQGRLGHDEVAVAMARAAFLVAPYECYENFPLTLAEAFSHGLPVLASRLGAMAEIVEDGVTGLLFEPGNAADLAAKVRWLHAHPEECRRMGDNARQVYEEKYTPERNYEMLMEIYKTVRTEC